MTKLCHLTSGTLLTSSHHIPLICWAGLRDLYVQECVITYYLSQAQTQNLPVSICWITNECLMKGWTVGQDLELSLLVKNLKQRALKQRVLFSQQQKEWPNLDVCTEVLRTTLSLAVRVQGPMANKKLAVFFESFAVTELSPDWDSNVTVDRCFQVIGLSSKELKIFFGAK